MNEKPRREIGLPVTAMVIISCFATAIFTASCAGYQIKPPLTQTPFPTGTSTAIGVLSPYPGPTAAGVLSPYPGPLDYRTSTETAMQTGDVLLLTLKASLHATHLATTPSPTPLVTFFPTGTEESMYVKPSGEKLGLDAQNAWNGLVDGIKVRIYAGALLWDLDQGALYLFVENPESWVSELILTPTKHGGIKVVSEQNNRLTMVSTDGTTYYLDVPARLFVNSLTEIVPSATPPATRTPFPPPLTPVTPLPTLTPYPAPVTLGTPSP
jgi:hypothetical protein